METIVIIGGGIVGLSIARELAETNRGDEIFLLEQEAFLGHHTTGRNSEVLHAGVAYPPHSLKTKLCVEGNILTYELAERLNIPLKKTGKWILATNDAEAEGLEKLARNVVESGAVPLVPHDPQDAVDDVPELKLSRACMFAPSTGMLDCAGYVQALDRHLAAFENVYVIRECCVKSIDAAKSILHTNRDDIPYDFLINSAGLWADEVYAMAGGQRKFQIIPYRGEYYRWKKATLEHVIYPVPARFVNGGDGSMISSLGIHVHRNYGGEVLLGPSHICGDVACKTDYAITTPPQVFIDAIAPFMKQPPTLDEVEMAYAGNRPKLFEDGKAIGDFVIFKEGNIVHLLGIESPGLTAAPAIGRYVADLLRH
ncbi:MAG: FAD-dependent oxidoreductase [Deltaproteobacteria bacterium]|nr:FAD-dependent oxidoreductase [Deltaproteobacteria bacterium]